MPLFRLGIELSDGRLLREGRRGDPLDFIVLDSWFRTPPRTAGARQFQQAVDRRHRTTDGDRVELVPVLWHHASHEPRDGIKSGTRRIPGSLERTGHLRKSDEVRFSVERTLAAAAAIRADRIWLRTPPSFGPTAENSSRVTHLAEQLGTQQPALGLVWEAHGLWEAARAAELAKGRLDLAGAATTMTGRFAAVPEHTWLRCPRTLSAAAASELALRLAEDEREIHLMFSGRTAYRALRRFAGILKAEGLA